MSDGCEGYAELEGPPRASRDLSSMGFKAPIRGADS